MANDLLSALAIRGITLALAIIAVPVLAQPYPSKPVRLVVPYPAGGPTDLIARMLADGLKARLTQTFVVENRPGASGNIGTDFVARSAPDGHTLLLSGAAALAVNVSLFANLPYDPRRDFAPITKVVDIPTMLVVPVGSPATTVAELLELARARPGLLNFASPTSGTVNHLLGELLRTRAQLDIVHIPYKGNPQATEALLRGDVSFMFDNLSSALPHWRAGKLRALAVTGPSRLAALPDTRTMTELGYPGFEATAWFAMLAPRGLPPELQARLNAELVGIMREPEFERRVEAFGMRVDPSTPQALADLIERDVARWSAIVKSSGARAD